MHLPQQSLFQQALTSMNAQERARAQRLRDAFNLSEDDAVWILCGLAKGFDVALRDIPTKCSQAAEHAALNYHGRHVDNADAPRTGWSVLSASLFISASVLVGSAAFTVGVVLQRGSAYWLPDATLSLGVDLYLLSAIWACPLGGTFALAGLVLVALSEAVLRLWRAASPQPARLGPSKHGHRGD
jgi:hypothetical protein